MNQSIPWYLRNKVITTICFIVPPIAFIIIVTNKNKLSHEKYIEHLTVATFILSLWMLKFLPGLLDTAIIFTLLIGYYIRKFIKNKK
ncbi:hypothetical protein [Bacillus sp. AFS041924]|uniref:hypothetical protein n=1 Tax=Bacillus sp. AFS041924 TaxID=2033503 RepID=UPI000BFBCCA5|nr:hypothetical protein [Bacillus sp. AFS041924]PGS55945.1 hypothetical protein COC46_03030 [Bacillus sp. AFS041924]